MRHDTARLASTLRAQLAKFFVEKFERLPGTFISVAEVTLRAQKAYVALNVYPPSFQRDVFNRLLHEQNTLRAYLLAHLARTTLPELIFVPDTHTESPSVE